MEDVKAKNKEEELIRQREVGLTKGSTYAKCPSCGAVMTFDPLSSGLKCEYCGSQKSIDMSVLAKYLPYNEDTEKSFASWGEVNNYTCSACGAKSVLPNYEMSPICPFCSASNLIKTDEIPGLTPNGILPFKIDKGAAVAQYKTFIKKKIFAPSDLRKHFKVDSMKGIYVPVFVFNCNSASTYNGRLGEHYTVTVGSGKEAHTETRTKYFDVSGSISKEFHDLQYEVSSHITQHNLSKLGFFDVNNAVAYDNSLFAGFSSERYTNSLDNTWLQAKEDIDSSVRSAILAKYDADEVDYLNVKTAYNDRAYKYELVPIWECTYKFKKKNYTFFINGRSGKAAGKAPLSPLKVAILVIIGIAVAVVIGLKAAGVI